MSEPLLDFLCCCGNGTSSSVSGSGSDTWDPPAPTACRCEAPATIEIPDTIYFEVTEWSNVQANCNMLGIIVELNKQPGVDVWYGNTVHTQCNHPSNTGGQQNLAVNLSCPSGIQTGVLSVGCQVVGVPTWYQWIFYGWGFDTCEPFYKRQHNIELSSDYRLCFTSAGTWGYTITE